MDVLSNDSWKIYTYIFEMRDHLAPRRTRLHHVSKYQDTHYFEKIFTTRKKYEETFQVANFYKTLSTEFNYDV